MNESQEVIAVRAILTACLQKPRFYSYHGISGLSQPHRYEFYPLNLLPKLVEQVRELGLPPQQTFYDNDLGDHSVQYVVCQNYEILFSRAGDRSAVVPSHAEISRTVLSAGHIHFSPDFSSIVAISLRSNDFRFSFDTLVFVLVLLNLSDDFPLDRQVEIINANGQSMRINRDALILALPQAMYYPPNLVKNNQSNKIVLDEIEAPSRPAIVPSMFFPPLIRRPIPVRPEAATSIDLRPGPHKVLTGSVSLYSKKRKVAVEQPIDEIVPLEIRP